MSCCRTEVTMKLWDSLNTFFMLLTAAVHAGSMLGSGRRRGLRTAESPLELPPVHLRLSDSSPGSSSSEADSESWEETVTGGGYSMEEPPQGEHQNMVDFIKVTIGRIRRSSSFPISSSTTSSTRLRRDRKKGTSQQRGRAGTKEAQMGKKVRRGRVNGRGHGCVLKQIHLNVSDLGLGYRSSEEMIFRYCSGPCRKSETNYDKILYNLVHNRRLPHKDTPPKACCRPTAFDDDLSFLDDNLVYHTVRKHSARKCGCV